MMATCLSWISEDDLVWERSRLVFAKKKVLLELAKDGER